MELDHSPVLYLIQQMKMVSFTVRFFQDVHGRKFIFIVPGAVSNLAAESRFTSIVLTWSPPHEPNGVIIAYEVTYRVNDTNSATINTTDISTTHTLELCLNTRVSGISVRAYTSVGPGNVAVHHDVSTPQQPTPREFK